MKNKFILYIAGLALVVLQPACQTTNITPQNTILNEDAFTTPTRIETAVIGVYDGLQSPEFLSGRSLIYSDVLGQDVIVAGSSAFFYSIYSHTMIATDAYATNEWNAGFAAIAKANRTMEGIQANLSVAGDNAKPFIAECKFARALAYFTLVNHFAQPYAFTAGATHPGLPIFLKSTVTFTSADQVPRNTVADVYKQIIADLKDAETDLPEEQSDAVQRANTYAASAILSRVYLYQGDYPNAKIEAEKVINSTVYSLTPNPGDPFAVGAYDTNTESIFSIANSLNDNPNTNNALPMHYNSVAKGGRADIVVSPTFLNLPGFAADDKRRSLMYTQAPAAGSTAPPRTYVKKYTDVSSRADWAPIIRYAEVLLTAAEASVRVSNTVDQTSLDRLNLVRDRSRVSAAQYQLADFPDAASFITKVLLERRIELAFEGHRIGDILRTKQNVTGILNYDYTPYTDQAYGSDYVIFPIPSTDKKLDPNLSQNPGYGN